MPHLLDGSYAKLDAARDHFGELEKIVKQLYKDQARAVSHEADPETGDYLARVRKLELPPRLRTLASDVLSNVRPPLDYLVYALALRDTPAKRPEGTAFPICDTLPRFKRSVKDGKLNGVSGVHIDRIEQIQPYHRGYEWLARLRDLSNPDKHHFPVSTLTDRDPTFRILSAEPPKPPRARAHEGQGTVLRRMKDDDVAIYLGLRLSVRFKAGDEVLPTLREFESGVRDILLSFHRDLV